MIDNLKQAPLIGKLIALIAISFAGLFACTVTGTWDLPDSHHPGPGFLFGAGLVSALSRAVDC